MYSLQLADGTVIPNLMRLNPSTFEVETQTSLYHQLNDSNLAFIVLTNEEDNLLEDVLIDYTLQNYSEQNGLIHFRIASIDELKKAEQRRAKKHFNI